MSKPRVSVLIDQVALSRGVMSPAAWKRLGRLAQVSRIKADRMQPDEIRQVLRGADAIITSWGAPRLEADLLDLAPDVRIIAHAAGSVRPVVSDEVWRRKIIVTSAASAIALYVAEYAIGCLIMGLRRLMANRVHVQAGRWSLDHETGRMTSLADARVGVVGAGFVGREIIKHLKAFGAEVAIYDPVLPPAEARRLGVKKLELLALARWADAVTLHAPELPQTYRMINADFIKAMKPHALLVNTARGKLVDEAALIKRLRKGDLAAILDVTDPEPPARNNPLLKLPNVLVTPHVAGAGNFGRLGEYAITEVELALAGKKPRYPVTQTMISKMA